MKKKHVIFILLIAVLLVAGIVFLYTLKKTEEEGSTKKDNVWMPDGLKVELMKEPYSIDTKNPSFSWYVNGKDDSVYQEKYRIVLSDTQEDMNTEKYLLDTGWCEDTENTYVKLNELDKVLKDNSVYYWKVRLEDTDGRKSEWSETACFSTDVGTEWADTAGIWEKEQPDYAFLRTEFECPDKKEQIEKALLSVTALSPEETRQYVYNVYLNEEYIGSGPARLKNGEINYNTFDVTENLQEHNILGAICYTNKEKAFLCQLTVFYSDGSKEIVVNSGRDSEEWKTFNGDDAFGKNETMISTSYYVANAENINASKYPSKWLKNKKSKDAWKTAVKSEKLEKESLVPYQTENMKKYYITPASVKKLQKGHYLVDLGKEIVGGIAIDVFCRGTAPTEVTFRYGEELDEKGNVKYQMRTANVYEEKWTLKFGKQKFENMGMKTFRYVEIITDHISFSEDSIKGVALRQPFDEEQSEFVSSDELLNQLYELGKYTVKATNQNLYVDSQSRERGAYEGDSWINTMISYAVIDSYTLARVSNEYLYAKRTWPAEYPMYGVMCAWQDYMYTGNIDSLRENYGFLKTNMESFPVDESCGLVKNDYGEDGFNRPLVDWPENERDDYAYDEAVYNTVVNAAACVAYENMSDIANALGKTADGQKYASTSQTIKDAMIRQLYNEELGRFSDGLTESHERIEHYAQHATAYALYAKICTDENMQKQMTSALKSDKKIKMSVFGAYFLLQSLYDNNAGEYATELLLEEDEDNQRTWAYMLRENQATISTEAWSPQIKDNMTYSHPWGASPICFITNGIFGIKPVSPAFEEFQVKLQPKGVESARIKVPTIKGDIQVAYQLDKKGFLSEIKVEVPSNTRAYLMIPQDMVEDEKSLFENMDVEENSEEGYYNIQLTAGKYSIQKD